jgi:hypothetical protein
MMSGAVAGWEGGLGKAFHREQSTQGLGAHMRRELGKEITVFGGRGVPCGIRTEGKGGTWTP